MIPLTLNDRESELSYAYLHAVASHAGASCISANRSLDGNGIDATITGWGPFPNGGYLEEITIHIQLKATIKTPVIQNGHFSYFVKGQKRYEDLRADTVSVPRLLVVLFLPPNLSDWLTVTATELTMKNCAHWISLRGAATCTNPTGETVYIPVAQIWNPNSLIQIFSQLSNKQILTYTKS